MTRQNLNLCSSISQIKGTRRKGQTHASEMLRVLTILLLNGFYYTVVHVSTYYVSTYQLKLYIYKNTKNRQLLTYGTVRL